MEAIKILSTNPLTLKIMQCSLLKSFNTIKSGTKIQIKASFLTNFLGRFQLISQASPTCQLPMLQKEAILVLWARG